jgi:hypothetical protein
MTPSAAAIFHNVDLMRLLSRLPGFQSLLPGVLHRVQRRCPAQSPATEVTQDKMRVSDGWEKRRP